MDSNDDKYVLRTCVIKNCTTARLWSTKLHRYVESGGKIFFRFPMNPVKRDRWIRAVSSSVRPRDIRLLYNDKIESFICEDHFNLERDMLNYQEYKDMKRYYKNKNGTAHNTVTLYLKGDTLPTKHLNPQYVIYYDPNYLHLLEHDYSLTVFLHVNNVRHQTPKSSTKPEDTFINTHERSNTSNENCFIPTTEVPAIKNEPLNDTIPVDYFEIDEYSEDPQLQTNRMSDGSETISVNSLEIIQCDFCSQEFCYKSDLLLHVQDNHLYIGPDEFHCSHCPASFMNENILLDHIGIAHGDVNRETGLLANPTTDNLILPETNGSNNCAEFVISGNIFSQTTTTNNLYECKLQNTECISEELQESLNTKPFIHLEEVYGANLLDKSMPSEVRSYVKSLNRKNKRKVSKCTTGKSQGSETKKKIRKRPLVQASIDPDNSLGPNPCLDQKDENLILMKETEPTDMKTCFVPTCNNDNTNSEKIFFQVPKLCKKWFFAVGREFPEELHPRYYCCEDHFDLKEDTIADGENFILKKLVLPHKCNEFYEKFVNKYPRLSKRRTRPKKNNANAKRKRRSETDLAYKGRNSLTGANQCGTERLSRKTKGCPQQGITEEATLDNDAKEKLSVSRKCNRPRKDAVVEAPKSIPIATDKPLSETDISEIVTPSAAIGFKLDDFEKHEQQFKNVLDGMARMRMRKETMPNGTLTVDSPTPSSRKRKAKSGEKPIFKEAVVRLERLNLPKIPMGIGDVNEQKNRPLRKSFDLQQFEQHEQNHENILNHAEDESVFDDNVLLKPLKVIKEEIINDSVCCLKCPELIPEGYVLCQKCKDEVLVNAVTIDPSDANTPNEDTAESSNESDERNGVNDKTIERVTKIEEATGKILTKDKNNKNKGKNENKYCEICQKQFTQSSKLLEHMRGTHGDESYKCDQCEIQFKHKGYLRRHYLRKHPQPLKNEGKNKNNYCEICQKQFTQSSKLLEHMRGTHGDESYKCDHCEIHFKRKRYLRKHYLRMHNLRKHPQPLEEVVKPLTCPICQQDFSSNDLMKRHAKMSHLGSAYCQLCHHVFVSSDQLNNHLQSIHQLKYTSSNNAVHRNVEVKYETRKILVSIHHCPHCPLMFSSQESLDRHTVDCLQAKVQFEIKVEPTDSDAEDWCIQ